jgi:hypothetical protein
MPQSKKKTSSDVSARRRKMQQKGRPWGYIVPAIIVLLVIVAVIYVQSRSSGPATTTPFGAHNWPFTCASGTESLFLHIHPWLRISIDGQNVVIPAAVGIQAPGYSGNIVISGSCYMPMHTHDSSGIIHIETTSDQNYTLADFFKLWAASYQYVIFNGSHLPIAFNSTDLFGLNTNSTYALTVLVDGKASTQFSSLVLNTLDYCDSNNSVSNSSPCYATVSQGHSSAGNPLWNGGQSAYPFGTGHTIQIEYGPKGTT